ncbi:MAG: transposase [Acidobacteriaceae bacterium]
MNLIDATGKCGGKDLLQQLMETALTKLRQFETDQQVSASRYERSGERAVYRNRYRERPPGDAHGHTGTRDPEIAYRQ